MTEPPRMTASSARESAVRRSQADPVRTRARVPLAARPGLLAERAGHIESTVAACAVAACRRSESAVR